MMSTHEDEAFRDPYCRLTTGRFLINRGADAFVTLPKSETEHGEETPTHSAGIAIDSLARCHQDTKSEASEEEGRMQNGFTDRARDSTRF